jgi:CRISPR-associated protein Csc3
MSTCVHELFGKLYNYDRALLQENRNRIKSGAEFAYRWLALQEKQPQPEQPKSTQPNKEGEAA